MINVQTSTVILQSSIYRIKHILGKCVTIGGEDINKTCQFPFIYKEITFRKCTLVDHDENTYWCATDTNSTNHYISTKWGDCSEACSFQNGTYLIKVNKKETRWNYGSLEYLIEFY